MEITLILAKPMVEASGFTLKLDDTPLAEAAVAALRQPGLEALQVRWSGYAFYILLGDGFTMPDLEASYETLDEFERGEVLVYVDPEGKGEIVVAYGDLKMFSGDEALECHLIGKVAESELDALEEVGKSIHRDVRTVSVD